ncbi:MAG: hypothetical protein JWP12_1962 [Bacteroidetes bacterium]|nr:hypothetical protein [Bacteroidota bacterium]
MCGFSQRRKVRKAPCQGFFVPDRGRLTQKNKAAPVILIATDSQIFYLN